MPNSLARTPEAQPAPPAPPGTRLPARRAQPPALLAPKQSQLQRERGRAGCITFLKSSSRRAGGSSSSSPPPRPPTHHDRVPALPVLLLVQPAAQVCRHQVLNEGWVHHHHHHHQHALCRGTRVRNLRRGGKEQRLAARRFDQLERRGRRGDALVEEGGPRYNRNPKPAHACHLPGRAPRMLHGSRHRRALWRRGGSWQSGGWAGAEKCRALPARLQPPASPLTHPLIQEELQLRQHRPALGQVVLCQKVPAAGGVGGGGGGGGARPLLSL